MTKRKQAKKFKTLIHISQSKKFNSKWTSDQIVKWKTLKLFEENEGEDICFLELGEKFLTSDTKRVYLKKQINKLG